MFKKRKNKISPDEKYLIAYILRGSTSSLLNYMATHPYGMNAARKDIIKIKYWFSKCHPVVQNLIRKMVTKFEYFNIDTNLHYNFHDDDYIVYTTTDIDTGYWFRCYDIGCGQSDIKIAEDGILTNSSLEHKMFVYAIKSVSYIKENIVQIQKDQKTDQMKQQYMEVYK
ncbi:hypothetical protein pEaSNUABM49_00149 [Erwinia phage pEa_SNUABM_49]|nr:hypothetical protein pEaSNUABM49_00149 [Erwinia phage pEa_SNUABM_49]